MSKTMAAPVAGRGKMAARPSKGNKPVENGRKLGESSSTANGKSKSSAELPDDELMQSLLRRDASFTALLSLIPAHLYLAPESDSEEGEDDDDDEDEAEADVTVTTKKRRQDAKAEAAAERKARIRDAKRAKLDPDNQKSAIEVQQERAAKRAERQAARGTTDDEDGEMPSMSFVMDTDRELMNGGHAGDTDSDGADDDDADSDDDDDDDDDGDSYETLPTSAKGSEELNDPASGPIPSPLPGTGPPSILDLRARLQAKIQGMQAQRRAPQLNGGHPDNGSAIGDDESQASTKDELLEERRKKRGEMRDNRRKAAKERKRVEREQVGKKGSSSTSGNDSKGNATTAPALFVSPPGRYGKGASDSASALNGAGEGDLAFSALKFEDDERTQKKSKHALPSDPKAALAILEARKAKEEARKAKHQAAAGEGDDAARDDNGRSDHQRWSKVEAAAQGVKIRDDETLLRKAAKKRDKLKEKSATEWKKRARDIGSQQAAKQKKRTENLNARKEHKKGGKKTSSSSSGSSKAKALGNGAKGAGGSRKARAGFEGKPRSFGGGGGGGGGGGRGGKASRGGGGGGRKSGGGKA